MEFTSIKQVAWSLITLMWYLVICLQIAERANILTELPKLLYLMGRIFFQWTQQRITKTLKNALKD